MNLFFQELKKTLRPIPLLVLVVVTALYSYTFLTVPYSTLNTMHWTSDYIRLTAELKELVGEPVTGEKIAAGVDTLRQKSEAFIEEHISNIPELAELGVSDFEGYRGLRTKIHFSAYTEEMLEGFRSGEAEMIGEFDPFDPEKDYTLTEAEQRFADRSEDPYGTEAINLLALEMGKLEFINGSMTDFYSSFQEFRERVQGGERFFDESVSEAGANRIYEIILSDSMMNIMPSGGTDMFSLISQLFMFLAILILVTVCILFAPVITQDNMTGIQALQYSSKTGRKALRIQFFAMAAATLLISLIAVGVTFGIYLGGVWSSFLHSGLHSFTNWYAYFWFNGTFGEWLVWVAVLIVGVSFASMCFVFALSKLASNYITLLLGLVPTVAVLVVITTRILVATFGITGSSYEIIPIPFVEVYVCAALLGIGGLLVGLTLKRQKKVELV